MRAYEITLEDAPLTDQSPTSDQQLDEFWPLIAAAAPEIIMGLATGIRVAAPYVGRALMGTAKVAARNPIKTTVGIAAATHPEETGKVIDAAGTAYSVVADPVAAGTAAVKQAWKTTEEAASDISKIVGNKLTPEAIAKLADAAIKYALPIVAVLAILYGGKKLYDYLSASPKPNRRPA